MSFLASIVSKIVTSVVLKALWAWFLMRLGKREAQREIQTENYKRRGEADEWKHNRLHHPPRIDPAPRFRVRDNPGRIRPEGDGPAAPDA